MNLYYVSDIIFEVVKLIFMAIYAFTVISSCVASLYFSSILGAAPFWVTLYALVGVMVLFRWIAWPGSTSK